MSASQLIRKRLFVSESKRETASPVKAIDSNWARRRLPRRNGFALVAVLTMMILLTLLALGLLSLSTITLRNSGSGSAQATARGNARLALMLAIGDLQKNLGPDQRVTANSSLLKANATASLANESWVGVWRTDGLLTDRPGTKMIRSNGSGYLDGRTNTAFDPKKQALAWLVSGTGLDPAVALNDTNSVEIRKGSRSVRAPFVPLNAAGTGRLAYWVSDESTKSRINLSDPYLGQQPDLANAASGGYQRVVAPLAQDPSVFFSGATAPTAAEASGMLSNRQIELSRLASGQGIETTKQRVREKADDFTVHSRSVLSDPLAGGMKADLSAFLEDGAVAALGTLKGLQDSDGIITELPSRTLAGPKFGMLRNWYALRNQITGGLKDRVITDQLPATTSTASAKITDPGSAFIKPLIQPVMTEAVYYLRHVINTETTPARMTELIYPRVVLWNPFNTKLKTSGHVVHFDFRLSHNAVVGWKNPQTGAAESKTLNLNLNFNYSYPHHLAFYVPPTEFEPGEALCFTSGGGSRVTPYAAGDSDIRSNVLSATSNPVDLKCFSRDWLDRFGELQTLPPTFNAATAKISYGGNSSIIWNNSNRTQTVLLHSLAGNSGAVKIPDLLSGNGPAVVRQISLDNYSRGNNGRWLVGYNPTRLYQLSDATAGGIPPDSLLAFGGRYRFLYETYANRTQGQSNNEPWFVAPMIHHNIGAPNIHRWPFDNIFGLAYVNVSASGISNGSGPHLYSYGPIAQARQWSEWVDPEVLPHRASNGKYRTAVFTDASFSTSNSTYPVYDLPSTAVPLVSLGALQHVQLSPFAWHPTQIIGHSFLPPYVTTRPAVTSRTATEENNLWSSKVMNLSGTGSSDSNYDITGFDKIGGGTKDILFNDISFEVNQALWDRYFLSAIPRSGWSGSNWDLSNPLPNPRLKIDPANSNNGSRAELANFHRAARSLWLEGGFNVNSTSINAWESLLRSFRDVNLPNRTGSAGSITGTAFAGVTLPEAGATKALAPTDEKFWNAYRKLTDDEIRLLATEITNQVRQRGPFLGVSDFVNRRLVLTTDSKRGKHANGGAIQLAIDSVAFLNDTRQAGWVMPTASAAANFQYGADYWGGPIAQPEKQTYESYHTGGVSATRAQGVGAAAHLNQADILQQIGSVLVARGDTFVVRGYGEAQDSSGAVTARAWCEAVVQRTPIPLNPDENVAGLNPKPTTGGAMEFGRAFRIESFRWLSADEV